MKYLIIIIIIIYIATELIINLMRRGKEIDDHGHAIKTMGKLKLSEKLREWIAKGSWAIFLWGIKMTDKEYWYAVYKLERDRLCIEKPPHKYENVVDKILEDNREKRKLTDREKEVVGNKIKVRMDEVMERQLSKAINSDLRVGDEISINFKYTIDE